MANEDEVSSVSDTDLDFSDMSNMSAFEKMSKLHAQLKEENSRLKSESGTLTEKLNILSSQCSELDKLKSDFNELSKENESRKMREEGFKSVIATYTKSSRVMDIIQEVGRSIIDKTGLGFELNPSTTSKHHVGSLTLCDSEPLNLNAQLEAESEGEITNPSQRQDKGKGILYIDVDGTESRNPNRLNNHFDSRSKTRSKPQNQKRKTHPKDMEEYILLRKIGIQLVS